MDITIKEDNWCTRFPEYWYNWKLERIYIGDICKEHDDVDDPRGGCASKNFAKGLYKRRVLGATSIFIVASIACWVKYPKSMWRRV